jgi:glycosyltransferase involved in cell wall biosynthesis
MPAHDVAIYSPLARMEYEPESTPVGGAELQTTLLARGLSGRGLRVAHVIFPLRSRPQLDPPAPTLVERPEWQGHGRIAALREAAAILRGLSRADARVYVVRGSGGHLIPAAAFCRVRRRPLVFSTSNELDFDFARPDRRAAVLRLYRYSIGHADRVVVQTGQQLELARSTVPEVESLPIPSFCRPAERTEAEPEYFLWVDRLVEYKRPGAFVDLAEAVPEARFRMVVAPTNETPPELEAELRARAAPLPNLELVAPRPREQLLADMTRSAAVVTTSRAEGMPNTFLEAWARGIPVLSLSVDPDARIADKQMGILAGDSPELLADGARRLWGDAGLRAAIGDRAREFVRDTHAPEAVTDRWQSLLEELLRTR